MQSVHTDHQNPQRTYLEIDVFGARPFSGNPVGVVMNADGLTDAQMSQFARWTNFSETTFLFKPTHANADYKVRIFTPSTELPFAGHPTLGSCHAWLSLGVEPKSSDHIVQECGVGLVKVKRTSDALAFAAPPLIRSGPID
jgi:PhzF family phenazine biosynthesis protein